MTATLERAEQSLAAARHLTGGGFDDQAVSQAYYAAFYAAEAALATLGVQRTKHSGVHSAFAERVVKPGDFDRDTWNLLPTLFDKRRNADYLAGGATGEEAASAIADAERFVAAVRDWLAERAQPS